MKRLVMAAVALLIVTAAPTRAQDADDIWNHVINPDSTTGWSVQPNRPRPRVVDAPGIPGESALRVQVASPGPNPWAVQASAPIAGAINAGDVILLMFYARAEVAAAEGSTLPARIQLSGAPYTAALESTEALTGEWTQHCAHTVSTQSFAANGSNVSVHLATAAHTIDLGPVFVFNLGPDFDRTKLPNCDG